MSGNKKQDAGENLIMDVYVIYAFDFNIFIAVYW
jgi:hypothetical protein